MLATTIPLDQWFILFCYDLFAHELVQAGAWEEFMELSEKNGTWRTKVKALGHEADLIRIYKKTFLITEYNFLYREQCQGWKCTCQSCHVSY